MCKGGGDGCIARSHGGEGTRSGGSAVVTCPGRATPTSATPYYAELARILVGARTLSSGRGASKCSPGARMGSEGACEPSVSASLCVSGGRVLVCACACVCVCVCVCARAHQLYVTPALSPPQSSGPARSSKAPNPSRRVLLRAPTLSQSSRTPPFPPRHAPEPRPRTR